MGLGVFRTDNTHTVECLFCVKPCVSQSCTRSPVCSSGRQTSLERGSSTGHCRQLPNKEVYEL